jgi:hypothetical protein
MSSVASTEVGGEDEMLLSRASEELGVPLWWGSTSEALSKKPETKQPKGIRHDDE